MFWDSDHFPNQPSTSREFSDAKVRGIDHELEHLHRRVERLALSCQAMWELLSEHTGITEEQLMARMEDIDFRDGSLDGKMKSGVMTCPTCKRRVNAKHSICMYCTHPIQKPHVFE